MYNLLFANEKGEVLDHPQLGMTGRLGNQWVEPLEAEIIPLPQGATLTMVPARLPLGICLETGNFKSLSSNPFTDQDEKVWAVAALLPQGYTRTLLPGFVTPKAADALPLLGYTAVGFKDGNFYVAAVKTDQDEHWNPCHYNTDDLEKLIEIKLQKYKHNSIYNQLAKCSLEYGCFTAQNIFYNRWEGGLPTSPVCNANCLGCISLQPSECCPSPQNRITFVPEVKDIVEVALEHLQTPESIISFGQGCEGEPSLQAARLAQAIAEVRKQTSLGTININTNGGYYQGIIQLVDAGLDTMRVSIISPNPDIYNPYYRPKGYSLQDVSASLKYAADKGVYCSLNLLAFPGVTDREEEIEALINFVNSNGVNLIQIRNLNIDPDLYLNTIPEAKGEILGTPQFLQILQDQLPNVQVGNYSKPVSRQPR
jgi:pyruvate-formate lyase-activating enzyme